MFNELKNRLIFGVEPSPTPIVPIDSDSISVSETSLSFHCVASVAATIQPDVPPPTMSMFFGMFAVCEVIAFIVPRIDHILRYIES